MEMFGVSERTFKMIQNNRKKCHEMLRIKVS